jgi:hypothetical protein
LGDVVVLERTRIVRLKMSGNGYIVGITEVCREVWSAIDGDFNVARLAFIYQHLAAQVGAAS